MLSDTFSGSFSSGGSGVPVLVAQNLHDRVQTSPKIKKVAVPKLQHVPMFGHFPLLQMVCNLCASTIFLIFEKSPVAWSFVLSQSGLRAVIFEQFRLQRYE
jgi:ABC-type uncharacterized transport system permease subunit